jgi:t-SNARE complex subunit (syntaxin)
MELTYTEVDSNGPRDPKKERLIWLGLVIVIILIIVIVW